MISFPLKSKGKIEFVKDQYIDNDKHRHNRFFRYKETVLNEMKVFAPFGGLVYLTTTKSVFYNPDTWELFNDSVDNEITTEENSRLAIVLEPLNPLEFKYKGIPIPQKIVFIVEPTNEISFNANENENWLFKYETGSNKKEFTQEELITNFQNLKDGTGLLHQRIETSSIPTRIRIDQNDYLFSVKGEEPAVDIVMMHESQNFERTINDKKYTKIYSSGSDFFVNKKAHFYYDVQGFFRIMKQKKFLKSTMEFTRIDFPTSDFAPPFDFENFSIFYIFQELQFFNSPSKFYIHSHSSIIELIRFNNGTNLINIPNTLYSKFLFPERAGSMSATFLFFLDNVIPYYLRRNSGTGLALNKVINPNISLLTNKVKHIGLDLSISSSLKTKINEVDLIFKDKKTIYVFNGIYNPTKKIEELTEEIVEIKTKIEQASDTLWKRFDTEELKLGFAISESIRKHGEDILDVCNENYIDYFWEGIYKREDLIEDKIEKIEKLLSNQFVFSSFLLQTEDKITFSPALKSLFEALSASPKGENLLQRFYAKTNGQQEIIKPIELSQSFLEIFENKAFHEKVKILNEINEATRGKIFKAIYISSLERNAQSVIELGNNFLDQISKIIPKLQLDNVNGLVGKGSKVFATTNQTILAFNKIVKFVNELNIPTAGSAIVRTIEIGLGTEKTERKLAKEVSEKMAKKLSGEALGVIYDGFELWQAFNEISALKQEGNIEAANWKTVEGLAVLVQLANGVSLIWFGAVGALPGGLLVIGAVSGAAMLVEIYSDFRSEQTKNSEVKLMTRFSSFGDFEEENLINRESSKYSFFFQLKNNSIIERHTLQRLLLNGSIRGFNPSATYSNNNLSVYFKGNQSYPSILYIVFNPYAEDSLIIGQVIVKGDFVKQPDPKKNFNRIKHIQNLKIDSMIVDHSVVSGVSDREIEWNITSKVNKNNFKNYFTKDNRKNKKNLLVIYLSNISKKTLLDMADQEKADIGLLVTKKVENHENKKVRELRTYKGGIENIFNSEIFKSSNPFAYCVEISGL